MVASVYDFLRSMGYHHPLHPAFTHVPVGLTIAGFVFIFLAIIFKTSNYGKTAKHCIVLALFAAIPTAVAGYFDWQVFYAGAFILPIIVTMILAFVLMVLLVILIIIGVKDEGDLKRRFLIHFLSLFIVIGIGYFGGELVFGKKTNSPSPDIVNAFVADGMKLFSANCSFCHYTDTTETKVGPGLKGLFQRDKMPVSHKEVSVEAVVQQLKIPFKEMPSFEKLTIEQVNALIEYLKTL
jgi:uncharacterized membrane protein